MGVERGSLSRLVESTKLQNTLLKLTGSKLPRHLFRKDIRYIRLLLFTHDLPLFTILQKTILLKDQQIPPLSATIFSKNFQMIEHRFLQPE